jgi:hypothetical protein
MMPIVLASDDDLVIAVKNERKMTTIDCKKILGKGKIIDTFDVRIAEAVVRVRPVWKDHEM